MGLKQRLLNNDFLLNDYNLYLEQCEKRTVKRYFVFVVLFGYHCILKKTNLLFSLNLKQYTDNFVAKLENYDVVSFDIFDTLIFRPFLTPVDLFFFVRGLLWHWRF